MAIDLDELERLHSEAAGTPYKAKDDWIYAQSVSHKRTFSRRPMAYTIDNRDGRYKPTETAAYIVAACNSLPALIKRVRELERQRLKLANLAICNNGCLDCPLEDVCLYQEGTVRDSKICSQLLINWAEQAAKEAGE